MSLSDIKSEQKWALNNSLKSWTLYNLNQEEMSLLISSMSENEIRLARVCREGEKEWASLSRDKNAEFFKVTPAFKNSQGYPNVEIRAESVTDTAYFVIKPKKVVQPRLHQRYEITVPCTVVGANDREFVTETLDLSEGGLYFKDLIPSWVAGYFLVIVNSQFQLMCSLVEDQKEKRRVQIVSEDSDFHYCQFKDWIRSLD